jgi:phosphoribosyl-ATP pyrophosphohydrolase
LACGSRDPGAPLSMAAELGPTLDRLWLTIQSRRDADPQSSYTARLFARGRAKIAQKLGEEAVETVIEGVGDNRAALISESADLIYHLLLLWAVAGVSPAEVAAELVRRESISGIAEKRARQKFEGNHDGL